MDEFLEYWFSSDVKINEEVFSLIEQFRAKGIKCFLASDQEKYRAQYILNKLDFKSRLDGCFFSCELGYKKSQPEYFQAIIQELGTESKDITYFDDEQKNVAVAANLGMDAHFYHSIKKLEDFL